MTEIKTRPYSVTVWHGHRGMRLCPLFLLLMLLSHSLINGQEVTDKIVATVRGGAQSDLVTYSDLVWQLALQPATPLVTPSTINLNQALQTVLDQRLILQEAQRLPGVSPTDKEVSDEIKSLMAQFPQGEFEQRLTRVGLSTDHLREIVTERVLIEKYLDFRFRSFTTVSPSEISDYYTSVWVPRFKRQRPGQIVPTAAESRAAIEKELTESKVESQIDEFLEGARSRAEITILSPV